MRAIVTVLGKDQVGIIAWICTQLAERNINVLDINQTIMQEYFTMVMLVDAQGASEDFARMAQTLEDEGRARGLSVSIQREDIFEAMHRI